MLKRYALLVISKTPIDPGKLKEQEGVEHFFNEELGIMPRGGGLGLSVSKSIPEQGGGNTLFHGYGSTVATTVTSWLHQVCSSRLYRPIGKMKGD